MARLATLVVLATVSGVFCDARVTCGASCIADPQETASLSLMQNHAATLLAKSAQAQKPAVALAEAETEVVAQAQVPTAVESPGVTHDVHALWVIGFPVGCVLAIALINCLQAQPKPKHSPPANVSDVKSTFLAANFKGERLSTAEQAMYTFQDGSTSYSQSSHLLRYDEEKVTTFSALFHLAGTHFSDLTMLRTLTIYWLIAAATASVIIFKWDVQSGIDLSSEVHIGRFRAIRDDVTMVVSFILGSFIATIVGRWWSCRTDGVGGLGGAIGELQHILAVHMPSTEDRPAKETVLRLCLLSFRLCHYSILGKDSEADLQTLVVAGLLTKDEMSVLKDVDNRPGVVWIWITQFIHGLAEKGKIKYKELTVPALEAVCIKGRNAIGGIGNFVGVQLPFPYVHLLSMMVIVTNLVVAIKGGLVIGRNVADNGEPFDAMFVLTEMVHLTVIPFFYHSFVKLGCELSNPMGGDFFDFPTHAIHVGMRDGGMALYRAAERAPSYIKEGKAEAEA